jgi:8-oxo-dGTP diphosphatase
VSARPEPDWGNWTPTERAALCFIVTGGRVLLIRKKRGLGAGKVNGPGGRLEAGESEEAAARRETREEVGLDPFGLVRAGELWFQFVDGYALHCAVFTASGASGTPVETDEADPFWAQTAAIPFDDMWTDDRHWIPWMLSGRRFRGLFHYEGDRMLSGRVLPAE